MNARWIVILVGCALLAGCAVFGPFGPFNHPEPPPALRVGAKDVKLSVVSAPNIKVPHLSIPRSLVSADQPKRAHAASIVPTIVTGLALSAALVVGGLWFAGKTNRAATAALLLLVVLLLGAGAALADLPRPWWDNSPRPRPGPPLPEANGPAVLAAEVKLPAKIKLPPDIQLEIVEAGDSIILTVPAHVPKPGK
jgi:hypothetical protein